MVSMDADELGGSRRCGISTAQFPASRRAPPSTGPRAWTTPCGSTSPAPSPETMKSVKVPPTSMPIFKLMMLHRSLPTYASTAARLPCALRSRITLPSAVRGNASTKADFAWTACSARCGRRSSASTSASLMRAPACSTTTATTASPQRSSGRPTMQASSDRRAFQQNIFDLGRIDVLAAGNDHVVLARDHMQIALVVEVADVAGMVPAAAQAPRRSLPARSNSPAHIRPAHEDFAVLRRPRRRCRRRRPCAPRNAAPAGRRRRPCGRHPRRAR